MFTFKQTKKKNEVTISTIRSFNIRNTYMHFLLHLNEDFDDDLLLDAINLLLEWSYWSNILPFLMKYLPLICSWELIFNEKFLQGEQTENMFEKLKNYIKMDKLHWNCREHWTMALTLQKGDHHQSYCEATRWINIFSSQKSSIDYWIFPDRARMIIW